MKKILIIIPDKLPQKLIMRGFCRGFKANKYYVLTSFEKELTQDLMNSSKPELIMSYADFSSKSDILKKYLKDNKTVKNIVYFAEEKNSDIKFPAHTLVFASDRYINKKFHYLPLAISSRTYGREFEGYKYVISFVGNPNLTKRVQILAEVVKAFGNNLSIFCTKKQFEGSVKKIEKYLTKDELVTYKYSYRGFLEDEREISQVLNASKINLNIITKFDMSLNFHAFETLAAGGFLLTNNAWAANEFFDLARDLETYENTYDLVDKIKFYLKRIYTAQIIAQNGKSAIRQGNTFKDRVNVILKHIK